MPPLTLADVRQRLTATGYKPPPAEVDDPNAWLPALPPHPTFMTARPGSTVCICSACKPPSTRD